MHLSPLNIYYCTEVILLNSIITKIALHLKKVTWDKFTNPKFDSYFHNHTTMNYLEKLLLKWNLFSPLNGTLISFCFIFLLFLYLSFLSILSVSLSFLLNFLSKKVYWKRFQNFPSPFWWDNFFSFSFFSLFSYLFFNFQSFLYFLFVFLCISQTLYFFCPHSKIKINLFVQLLSKSLIKF